MLALAARQARGLANSTDRSKARTARRIELFSWALAVIGSFGACSPHSSQAIAVEADAKIGSHVYEWLAEHDPSALVIAGLDPSAAAAVAPDAVVSTAHGVANGCRMALAHHALLAAYVRRRTPDRDAAEDCGFALYRDDTSIVVAPR